MSDVERICMMNHQYRKWAEERNAQLQARENRKNAERKRKNCLRAATLFCAVFVGIGLTLLVMGIEAMHLQTILFGLAATVVFGGSGWMMEELTCE